MAAPADGPSEPEPGPAWPEGLARTAADREALVVLSAMQGTTPAGMMRIANGAGSASATLRAIRDGLAGSPGDRAFARHADADALCAAAGACGARLVAWGDAEYPPQLANIPDPPAALYVIGRQLPEVTAAVAVVGARRCTALGRELAQGIGAGLARAGVTVVSGAARGIDAAAHEGALRVGGATLAVLGCGIDVVYPSASRELLGRIRADGTVISEFAPGLPPEPRRFPARNRIVAGLSAATVVVEGADGSGSLITAEHALEFGRDVFAVPGPVTSPLAQVPLQLIRDGGTMIRGAEDLLADLGLELAAEAAAGRAELDGPEREVLERLVGPTLPDAVASSLGRPVPEVLATLMALELRGFARSVGGRFEPTLKAAARPA